MHNHRILCHKHIVFGAEHYNPLGLVRSLGEENIPVIAVIIKNQTSLTSASKYISDLYIVDDIDSGFSLIIEKFSDEEYKPFIYTSDDVITSLLDVNYEQLKEKFYFFNANCAGRITTFQDKNTINQLAIKHGLNVAQAVVVNRGEIPNNIQYPIITKAIASTKGAWKQDVFICKSESELIEAYAKIKSDVLLLQQYITKKNELCIDGFSINQGKDVFYAIASNYKYILPDTYSSYMTVFNSGNEDLHKKLTSMFSEIGFEGIFSVEFLVGANGELYFCEINFRNSTWSYAATCAGMNLPVLWAKSTIDKKIDKNDYSLVPPDFTAIVEVSDYYIRVKGKKIGIVNWIKDVKRANCRYFIGKKDIMPVVSFLISMVKKRIGRKK